MGGPAAPAALRAAARHHGCGSAAAARHTVCRIARRSPRPGGRLPAAPGRQRAPYPAHRPRAPPRLGACAAGKLAGPPGQQLRAQPGAGPGNQPSPAARLWLVCQQRPAPRHALAVQLERAPAGGSSLAPPGGPRRTPSPHHPSSSGCSTGNRSRRHRGHHRGAGRRRIQPLPRASRPPAPRPAGRTAPRPGQWPPRHPPGTLQSPGRLLRPALQPRQHHLPDRCGAAAPKRAQLGEPGPDP